MVFGQIGHPKKNSFRTPLHTHMRMWTASGWQMVVLTAAE